MNKIGNGSHHAIFAVAIVAIVAVAGLALFWSDMKGPAASEEWSPVGEAIAISSTLECDDSDSAGEEQRHDSVFVAGSVTTRKKSSTGVWGSWTIAKSDSCSGSTLTEWYCKAGTSEGYAPTNVACANGCSAGKCNAPVCDGPTGPDVYTAKGAIGIQLNDPTFLGVPPSSQAAKRYTDTCIDSTKTREYWCSGGFVTTGVYACFSGYTCSGGRCVPPACTDGDGDGYQGSSPSGCSRTTTLDCNDASAAIKPGAAEICGDGVDQNCDGADFACTTCSDSDGGNVTTVGGTVREMAGSYYVSSISDRCKSSTVVTEFYCMVPVYSVLVANASITCAAGQTCIDPDGPYGTTPAYCG